MVLEVVGCEGEGLSVPVSGEYAWRGFWTQRGGRPCGVLTAYAVHRTHITFPSRLVILSRDLNLCIRIPERRETTKWARIKY